MIEVVMTTGAIRRAFACHTAPVVSQVITNKPTSSFLQAGYPSCPPINSVKAMKRRGSNVCGRITSITLRQYQAWVNWEGCNWKGVWHKTGEGCGGCDDGCFLSWFGNPTEVVLSTQFLSPHPAPTKSRNVTCQNKGVGSVL